MKNTVCNRIIFPGLQQSPCQILWREKKTGKMRSNREIWCFSIVIWSVLLLWITRAINLPSLCASSSQVSLFPRSATGTWLPFLLFYPWAGGQWGEYSQVFTAKSNISRRWCTWFFFSFWKVCFALLRSFKHIVIASFLLFILSLLLPSTDIDFSLKTPGCCRLLISCIFIFSLLAELLRWGAHLDTSQIPLCVCTVYIYLCSTNAPQEWKPCQENIGDNYF